MSAHNEQGGARVRLPPPLLFLAAILSGVALRYLHPLSAPVGALPCYLAGGALVAAGVSLIAAAFGWFKRSGQDPAPWKPSPSLIAAGPYRYTRNPMYVGMTLIQAGVGVALDNLWILALCVVSLTLVHFQVVKREEAYLTEKFGDDYLKYKASVRRYL